MTLSDSRMVIDTAGNVGIGTTSPAHNLQVESSGNAEIQAQRTSGAGVLIQAQSATGVVGTNTNHRLDLKTNGTTRATISTSGNVGIGTTTPATKLHIADLSSPTIRIEDTTNNRNLQLFHDNNDSYIRSSTGSQLRFQTDGGNDRMLIDTSGNVGIGTTVPASKLHVKASNSGATTEVNGTLIVEAGSSPSIQILSANSQTQQIKFGDPEDGDAGAIIYSHADNEMNLKTNAANRLTIDSSGNVGIGTTSPGRTFDVLSTDNIAARFKSDSNKGAISVEDNDTIAYISAENNRIGFGPTSALSVNNITINTLTNNVGIGNTTPASKLVVDGGDIEIDDSASGLILRSPDGTRYRVTVANGGAISASAV